MKYEWDPKKAAANLAKHGVSFESVKSFAWDDAIINEDKRRAYGEHRFSAIGLVETRLHVLVFTTRRETVRIIGLRKADKREMRRYEKKKA